MCIVAALLFDGNAFSAGDLSKQTPIVVRVDLGKSATEKHKYYPDRLTFETGKLYKLVLHNPSNSKHYLHVTRTGQQGLQRRGNNPKRG